jgi:L-threonine-O-3-phosphate decarboxylase
MEPSQIIRLARDEVKGLEPCAHGGEIWRYYPHCKDVLDFSANINPLGPPRKAVEAIKRSLWQIPFYPDPESNALRNAISEHLGGICPENVIVGNGSTELIHLFCEIFIKNGDEAIIPIPTFGEYENAVKKAGGIPKYVRLNDNFRIDPSTILKEVGSKTKVIFLCNPNNPTSTLIPRSDLLEIIENGGREHVLVFVDESFIEFVDGDVSLASEVKTYKNLFILRSFTKSFGLTGLRIGYGVSYEEIINLLLRGKIPWNVNCLAQAAAIAVLQDREYLKGYLEKTRKLVGGEREFLLDEFRRVRGLKVFPAHANFILLDIRQTGLTAAQLKERMLKHGILIRDCSSFKGLDKYYIRVAVRTRQENEKLLAVLRKIIGNP